MTLASLSILCTAWADTVPLLGVLLCLTFIGNDLAMGPAWAAAADIGGRHTGVLSGAMNMMASLTAALGALATGYLSNRDTWCCRLRFFPAVRRWARSPGWGLMCDGRLSMAIDHWLRPGLKLGFQIAPIGAKRPPEGSALWID